MKRLAFLAAVAGLSCLGGCLLPNDPTVVGRSAWWFRHTNPAKFFAGEESHGRVYFIGIYDPADGEDSPVPGVARNDPAYRVSRTWFLPLGNTLSPARDQRYVASAREFARRYNPLVLAYFRQHPAEK